MILASWKKLLPFLKAKSKTGSQSLTIISKHACKYQGSVCGGNESHRISDKPILYFVKQRIKQVSLKKLRTEISCKCSFQKGHSFLKRCIVPISYSWNYTSKTKLTLRSIHYYPQFPYKETAYMYNDNWQHAAESIPTLQSPNS